MRLGLLPNIECHALRAIPSVQTRTTVPGRMDEDRMLAHLAEAARAAREAKGRLQVHIAASVGVNQVTILRFEQGKTWPRNPDRIIAAYADDLDIDPREIWDDALTRWRRTR